MKTKTATLKKIMPHNGKSDQILVECDPPLDEHTYVIASSVVVDFSGPETYLFPADKEGKILDFSELRGSMHGTLSHERALENAGYKLVIP